MRILIAIKEMPMSGTSEQWWEKKLNIRTFSNFMGSMFREPR
jgi:hypothetical protein